MTWLGNDPEYDSDKEPEPPTKAVDKPVARSGKRNAPEVAPGGSAERNTGGERGGRGGRRGGFTGSEDGMLRPLLETQYQARLDLYLKAR